MRGIYERGDFDRNPGFFAELAHPDVEYVNPSDAVEAGTRRGVDAVIAALEDTIASFEWMEHKPLELFDAGDQVVASVRFRARGAASGVEVEQNEAHTWTFREGKIVRLEWGRDLNAALEAVGLQ
ncbi:MAG: nuclear transport factor 2 family protein [Solirubrobacterales bacterium]